ncbi:hypothetical protein K491DRAFT_713339 [Lophiostoma macrostomum CBS 122681]|uniref:Uncharacterized protein n=1 Tax=Lophiostoma macrostomum CBS 122681 TaxID=1314788 RepID=A0A6A6TI73_9PLEO|nr:hypothetical protein K491DRAFT_713339 [Lophiostoma macrostomum CBS 122681]
MLMERELEQRNREWRKRDIAQQQLPIRSRVLQSFIDRKDGKPAAAGMSSGVPNARTPSLADRRHTQNAPRSIGWGHLTAPTVASGSTGRCCALPARYRCPWWRLEGERELPKFVTDLFGVPEAGQSRREHQEQPSSTCSEETPSQNVSSERMATLQNEPWDLPSADPRRDSQRPHPVKGTNTNGQEVDTNTQFREISPSNGEHGFKEAWWELERDHESNDDGTIESDGTQGPGRDDCEMPQKLETEEDGDTLSENMQEQDTGP